MTGGTGLLTKGRVRMINSIFRYVFFFALPQTFGRRSIHTRFAAAHHVASAEKSIFSSVATQSVLKRRGLDARRYGRQYATRDSCDPTAARALRSGRCLWIRFSAYDLRTAVYHAAVRTGGDKCRKSYRSPVMNRRLVPSPRRDVTRFDSV